MAIKTLQLKSLHFRGRSELAKLFMKYLLEFISEMGNVIDQYRSEFEQFLTFDVDMP